MPAHRPANPSTLALQALPFLEDGSASDPRPLLTEAQRQTLEQIGVRVRLPPRLLIYQQDSRADWLFAVVDGVVKSYRELPSGKRAVAAFLFPRDLFGLAEKGRYVNCAKTITRATMYRFPLPALTDLIKRDPELQFQFLVKVTHVLRESQRRAITIARRDAAGRMAMFLVFMQRHPTAGGRDRDIDAADEPLGHRGVPRAVARGRHPCVGGARAAPPGGVRRPPPGARARFPSPRQARRRRVGAPGPLETRVTQLTLARVSMVIG